MKIKIKSASRSTFWYANQIGSTFNVKVSDIHKDDYMLDENLVDSTLAIKKSDCKIMREESPQPEPFDLERAKKGEVFYSKDGFTRFKVVALSSFNDKLHIVETVRNGDADVEMFNLGVCSPDNHYMAPKEPEYLEGWVIVDKYGIAPCVYPDVKSASHSAVFNNADRKFRIEKIRFPKP